MLQYYSPCEGTLPDYLPFCSVQSLLELGQVVQSLQLISDLGRLLPGRAARLVLQHSRTRLGLISDNPFKTELSIALQVQHTQYISLIVILRNVFSFPPCLTKHPRRSPCRLARPMHCLVAFRVVQIYMYGLGA